jgi:hypothetical protein
MKTPLVLNFSEFIKLFEEEETKKSSDPSIAPVELTDPNAKTIVDNIMFIYFQIFGLLATRTGGYRDVVNDYQEIANAKNKDRGQIMVNVIDKVIGVLTQKFPIFSPIMGEYKESVESLKKAYDLAIDKYPGQSIGLSKRIKDMTIEYLTNLVDDVRKAKYPAPKATKSNESYEFYGDLLLEKDLYYKERSSLLKKIIPLKSKAENLEEIPDNPDLKSFAKKAIDGYSTIIANLEDDSVFDKLKKREERAKKIQIYREAIIKIENEINNKMLALIKSIAKEKIDEIIKGNIDDALTKLNGANNKLIEIEKEKAANTEKAKIEKEEKDKLEKENSKKDEKSDNEYKDIDKNSSSDSIKKLQEKLKIILPNSSVIVNGKYDDKLIKNLTEAISLIKTTDIIKSDSYKDSEKISKITPELQKNMDEYIKILEKIRKK